MQNSALRPSRRYLSVTLAFAVCGIGSWGGAAWADEKNRDEPEVVKPVELGGALGTVGPIGVENAPSRALPIAPIGSLAPIPAAGSVSAISALGSVGDVGKIGFNLSAMERDAALIQIKAGALTMEEAWQSGALTYDNIVDLLEHPADPWVINERKTDDGLHHQLIELLLQHESKRLEDLPKVSQRVRLWLADYYQSRVDKKAIAVAESIVAEHQQPTKGWQDVVFQALERVAWYYRNDGQHEKSAQIWERLLTLMPDDGWWKPDAMFEAAYAYEQAGYLEKAEGLYSSAPVTKFGWQNGLIATNYSQLLIREGHYDEARQLLNKGVTGSDAELMEPFILTNLGDSYYREGKLIQAASYANQAITNYKTLTDSSYSIYLDAVLSLNQERLRWIEKFTQHPIICAPLQLNVVRSYLELNIEDDEINRQFYVRTLRPASLRVSSDNPLVTARIIEDQSKKPQQRHYYQQEISVSIAPEAIRRGAQATLTISSSDIPSFQAQMPVLINKQVDSTTNSQP